ncbi:hypothetical protein Srufu_039760 [Streptomyces libani subsp. rufus]|nr:hypothetical protein Srufu_039760 [Streptomyces libani subsp. rufus]
MLDETVFRSEDVPAADRLDWSMVSVDSTVCRTPPVRPESLDDVSSLACGAGSRGSMTSHAPRNNAHFALPDKFPQSNTRAISQLGKVMDVNTSPVR